MERCQTQAKLIINTSPKPQHPFCFSTSPNLSGLSLPAYHHCITCKAFTIFKTSVVTVLRRDSNQCPGLKVCSGRTVHPTAYLVLTAIDISNPFKPDVTTQSILRVLVTSRILIPNCEAGAPSRAQKPTNSCISLRYCKSIVKSGLPLYRVLPFTAVDRELGTLGNVSSRSLLLGSVYLTLFCCLTSLLTPDACKVSRFNL